MLMRPLKHGGPDNVTLWAHTRPRGDLSASEHPRAIIVTPMLSDGDEGGTFNTLMK